MLMLNRKRTHSFEKKNQWSHDILRNHEITNSWAHRTHVSANVEVECAMELCFKDIVIELT